MEQASETKQIITRYKQEFGKFHTNLELKKTNKTLTRNSFVSDAADIC
jgi:hypothetical protein